MNLFPIHTEFKELAAKGNVVPVYADFMADFETPVSAYAKLREKGPSFLFESIEGGQNISRYSFVGCSPRKTFTAYADHIEITSNDGKTEMRETPADPLAVLEEEMGRYCAVNLPDMPRFTGGAVGFVGYEYIHRVETTVAPAETDTLGMPMLYFMLADTVVIFDHVRQTMRICTNAHIGDDADDAYKRAAAEIEGTFRLLKTGSPPPPLPLAAPEEISVPQGNFTRESFENMVERSKEYIRAGDIIQVVLSQRFSEKYEQSPLDLYRALRVVNPSPYMFIVDSGKFATVGASPEVHVRLTGELCESRPIAGTRPRGADEAEDLALEKDLLADEKERAEHLMLVDLARNDLGRVCQPGTVEVTEYAVIERYSHVMHIVSQVQGTIDSDKNAYDLLRATFPAGTVSGAPKVRAMQIISEMEGSQRGSYAGALGYFGYDGSHDTCIAIRTALLKDGQIHIQSGAGIVADSVPASEYQETINKARAMFKAVALSRHIK